MTSQEAMFICDNLNDEIAGNGDLQQVREAWQTIINSGIVWHLEDWYSRTANDLIDEGFCYDPHDIKTIH